MTSFILTETEQSCGRLHLLFFWAKIRLWHSTNWTYPVLRNVLKRCSWIYSTIWVAFFWVIYVTTGIAYVFLHVSSPIIDCLPHIILPTLGTPSPSQGAVILSCCALNLYMRRGLFGPHYIILRFRVIQSSCTSAYLPPHPTPHSWTLHSLTALMSHTKGVLVSPEVPQVSSHFITCAKILSMPINSHTT